MSIAIIEDGVQRDVHQWELLQMLIDQIREYGPERFDMETFGSTPTNTCMTVEDVVEVADDIGGCGTTACQAGHAIKLLARLHALNYAMYGTGYFPAINLGRLADLFGVSWSSYSGVWHDWPDTMRTAYVKAAWRGMSRRRAEWLAVLAYLEEIKDKSYLEWAAAQERVRAQCHPKLVKV